jgi:hypothetical protein
VGWFSPAPMLDVLSSFVHKQSRGQYFGEIIGFFIL